MGRDKKTSDTARNIVSKFFQSKKLGSKNKHKFTKDKTEINNTILPTDACGICSKEDEEETKHIVAEVNNGKTKDLNKNINLKKRLGENIYSKTLSRKTLINQRVHNMVQHNELIRSQVNYISFKKDQINTNTLSILEDIELKAHDIQDVTSESLNELGTPLTIIIRSIVEDSTVTHDIVLTRDSMDPQDIALIQEQKRAELERHTQSPANRSTLEEGGGEAHPEKKMDDQHTEEDK